MKHKHFGFYIFAVFLLFSMEARASWLIDQERFHISVHGRTSCGECHEDFGSPKHPDPGDVNKSLYDFFHPEMCSDCHDSVDDYINAGSHGGREVTKADDIKYCLDCHDPHYDSDKSVRGMMDSKESLPVRSQCGLCHDKQEKIPSLDAGDEDCMSCHRLNAPDRIDDALKASAICLHCHDGEKNKSQVVAAHKTGPHQDISCTVCHQDSAQFGHSNQGTTDCLSCHSHHEESVAHDAHINISCQACHLGGVTPVRDDKNKKILWEKSPVNFFSDDIHQMKVDDENSCSRCHFPGNTIGAAAVALPAKSLICMPCHTATFSIGDTVTLVALAVFSIGILMLILSLLSGRMGENIQLSRGQKLVKLIGKTCSILFSRKIMVIFKSLLLDSLLQPRLLAQSASRWMIHGLIFYPFVIRFLWGIIALLLSLWLPDCEATRMMIDKNNPATALLFDITGLMVLIGVGIAVFYRNERPSANFKDMPKNDWPASLLLAGIVGIGFVLEGVRITMTGCPEGASYAFVGYGVSLLLEGMTRLTDLYGYLWYAHAVFTGMFVAYLPFSRMLHMILSPVVMALDRIEKERK